MTRTFRFFQLYRGDIFISKSHVSSFYLSTIIAKCYQLLCHYNYFLTQPGHHIAQCFDEQREVYLFNL